MSDIRVVHASNATIEVVRYDRSGKWYVENVRGTKREPVKLAEAVAIAVKIKKTGKGRVYFGLMGGQRFDAAVRREIEGASS